MISAVNRGFQIVSVQFLFYPVSKSAAQSRRTQKDLRETHPTAESEVHFAKTNIRNVKSTLLLNEHEGSQFYDLPWSDRRA